MAGQGTAGLEIVSQCREVGIEPDQVLVNCSGGGLDRGNCRGGDLADAGNHDSSRRTGRI